MSNPFVTVTTVHQGEIAWWWTDEKLHDTEYHFQVHDAIEKKIKALKEIYSIEKDADYRCQWEGVQIVGSELADVENSALEIARYLAKFKGVRPL